MLQQRQHIAGNVSALPRYRQQIESHIRQQLALFSQGGRYVLHPREAFVQRIFPDLNEDLSSSKQPLLQGQSQIRVDVSTEHAEFAEFHRDMRAVIENVQALDISFNHYLGLNNFRRYTLHPVLFSEQNIQVAKMI